MCFIRGSLCLTLCMVLCLACQDGRETPSLEEYQELTADTAKKLAELGYSVDLGKLRIVMQDEAQVQEDFDLASNLYFEGKYFEFMNRLLQSLGLTGKSDASLLRCMSCMTLPGTSQAYYQIDQDKLVFPDPESVSLNSMRLGLEETVARELVRAYQDQQLDLVQVRDKNRNTVESLRIMNCIMEGEALWAVSGIRKSEEQLLAWTPGELGLGYDTTLCGDSALAFDVGRAFVAHQFHVGGWPAVRECLHALPSSTEQILHPEKYQLDLPVEVGLPDFGMEVLYEDTLGEMQIYLILKKLGLDRDTAVQAAVGWDGDRLQILTQQEGKRILVWRTAWDREEDAEQFAHQLSLRLKKRGTVHQNGKYVDWSSKHPSEELNQRISTALAASHVKLPPEAADGAASTLAIEEALERRPSGEPYVEAGIWVHPDVGLGIPIPDGWELGEDEGAQVLIDPKAEGKGIGAMIRVDKTTALPGSTLDSMIEASRKAAEATSGMKLLSSCREKVSNYDVASSEMQYDHLGLFKMRALSVVFLRDGKAVVITALFDTELWDQYDTEINRHMKEIKIDP